MSYGSPPQTPPSGYSGYYPPAPPQPQPPGHRQQPSHRARNIVLISFGMLAALIVGVAAGAGSKGATAAPRPAVTVTVTARAKSPARPAAASRAAKPAATTRTIAVFTGSGIQNTPQFAIGGDGTWQLDWSYSCASFGQSGNFIVSTDNNNDINGVNVNELSTGGHGATYAYSDAGRHFLSVNSECAWRVKVIGTP